MTERQPNVAVVVSERLARYGFGDGHPFGPDRLAAFVREFAARGLAERVPVLEPRAASDEELRSFHTPEYLEFVRERSASGTGSSMAATRRPSRACTRRLRASWARRSAPWKPS